MPALPPPRRPGDAGRPHTPRCADPCEPTGAPPARRPGPPRTGVLGCLGCLGCLGLGVASYVVHAVVAAGAPRRPPPVRHPAYGPGVVARGVLGSVLVLVGSLGGATLPGSTPLLGLDLLRDVRGSEAGRMVALSVVMLGLGLLAAQWLVLCRRVASDPAPRRHDAVRLVRRATLLWSVPLLVAPPLFSRDGWSYAAQGMLAHLGLSPYEHGPGVLHGPVVEAVDPRWMDTVTPYGPLPLWLGELGAGVTGNPWVLVVGHRLVAVVGLVLLAWAVPRLARWGGVDEALASALVLASPLMLTNGVAGLHNDLLMVGLMAAALVVAGERGAGAGGWWWGAVLGGLAAAVKAPGGLVCLAVVLVTLPVAASLGARAVRTAQVALVSVGTLVGLGLVTGLGSGWVGALGVPGTVSTPLSHTTLLGGLLDRLAALVGLGLPDAALVEVVRHVGTLAAVVVALLVLLRRPTGDRASGLASLAVVLGVLVLLSPVVHLWYLLWVTPFLATQRLPWAATTALVGGSVALGLAAPLDSSLHGAYLAITLGCVLMAVLVPLLLLTRRSRERVRRITQAARLPV